MADDRGTRVDPSALAREWAAAVAGTSYLPMEHAELEAFLAGLAGRLVAKLDGDPPDADPDDPCAGQEIGAALVAAHLASAEGLGRTVEVLTGRLLPDPSLAGQPYRARLARLLGAVVTGFARALRDRTLDEQEAIRRAVLLARQQAEVALRESEARFRYQATHDPLTGLANRTLFTDRLGRLFAHGTGSGPAPRRLGVCFVDLDGFKVVNDTLGHHVGDLLLTSVAGRLRQHLPDHLIARLGGDEFVILVEDTSGTDDVIKVAETALAAIAEPTTVDGHELSVSASFGIVERELGMSCPSEVLRAADLTLQWAKSEGKGRWAVFDPVRNERELARYALSAALPAALDRGELFLEYQPVVSLTDGTVRAVEALVRWRHPEHGVLGPDQFLPLAAETGMIVRLGGWVLAQACHEARRWEQWSGHPPLVSVNLAPRQVRDPGLVELVTATLESSGLPTHRLQLEITEAAVLGTDEEPLRTLHRLSELGVRLAVDDFGTGYCNLPALRILAAQELKIAGVFLAGLPRPDDPAGPDPGTTVDGQILATLISLAHTLGLAVTAEQVETAAQAETLRALGCDAAQGWHFGRPVPPDALPESIMSPGT